MSDKELKNYDLAQENNTTFERDHIDNSLVEIITKKNEENKRMALEKSKIDRKNLKLKNARKRTLRKRILITAIIILVAAGASVKYAPVAIDHYNKVVVTEAFEGKYGDKLHDIVSRTANPAQGNFDYVEIANEIRDLAQTPEELDNIIYELYNDYGKLKGFPIYDGITDKTIQYIPKDEKNLEFYEGFEDYYKSKGFKSPEDYDVGMRQIVLSEYNKEENVSKGRK